MSCSPHTTNRKRGSLGATVWREMASICHISLNVVFIGNRYQKEAVHYIGYDFLHYIHTFLSGPQHLHLPVSYPTFPINPARVHGNNRQRLWSHLCGLEVFLLDALHLHLPEDFGLGVWLAQVAVVNDAWFPQKTCSFVISSRSEQTVRLQRRGYRASWRT